MGRAVARRKVKQKIPGWESGQRNLPGQIRAELFYESLISAYLDAADSPFIERRWLVHCIERHLENPNCRYVLVCGPSGVGKSALMASLARQHPNWPRYFIRRDSRLPLHSGDVTSFLFAVGHQLAALYPAVFRPNNLEIIVKQRIGRISTEGNTIGARIEELRASPFYRTSVTIEQHVQFNEGNLEGLSARQVVADPRLLDVSNLQFLALLDPASALCSLRPDARVVVLLDALDELRYQVGGASALSWLASAPELPPNVKMVLTSRSDFDLLDQFRARQSPWIIENPIDPDSRPARADVTRYAEKLGSEKSLAPIITGEGDSTKTFAASVAAKAKGNFQYVATLFRAIAEAVRREDLETAKALVRQETLPVGLEELYSFFVALIKDRARDKSVLVYAGTRPDATPLPVWSTLYEPILGLLSVAFEPLTVKQLLRFTGSHIEERSIYDALEAMSQFLDSRNQLTQCYSFYHPTFGEFIARARDSNLPPGLRAGAAQWHRRIVASYQLTDVPGCPPREWAEVPWASVDDYGINHLSKHLEELAIDEQGCRQLVSLICRPLLDEKRRRFGSAAAIMGDVEAAFRGSLGRMQTMRREIYGRCFLQATLRSFGSLAPYELPLALGALGRFKEAETLIRVLPRARQISARANLASAYLTQGDVYAARAQASLAAAQLEKYDAQSVLASVILAQAKAGDVRKAAKTALEHSSFGIDALLDLVKDLAADNAALRSVVLLLAEAARYAARQDNPGTVLSGIFAAISYLHSRGAAIAPTESKRYRIFSVLSHATSAIKDERERSDAMAGLVCAWYQLGLHAEVAQILKTEKKLFVARTLLLAADKLRAEAGDRSVLPEILARARRSAQLVKRPYERIELARALARHGQTKIALQLARTAIAKLPRRSAVPPEVRQNLMMALADCGQWAKLPPLFKQALEAAEEMARTYGGTLHEGGAQDYEYFESSRVAALVGAGGREWKTLKKQGRYGTDPVIAVATELAQANQLSAARRAVEATLLGVERLTALAAMVFELFRAGKELKARELLSAVVADIQVGLSQKDGSLGEWEYRFGNDRLNNLLQVIRTLGVALSISTDAVPPPFSAPDVVRDSIDSAGKLLAVGRRDDAVDILERARKQILETPTQRRSVSQDLTSISLAMERTGEFERAVEIARGIADEECRANSLLKVAVQHVGVNRGVAEQVVDHVQKEAERRTWTSANWPALSQIATLLEQFGYPEEASHIAELILVDLRSVGVSAATDDQLRWVAQVFVLTGRLDGLWGLRRLLSKGWRWERIAKSMTRPLMPRADWKALLRLVRHIGDDAYRIDFYCDLAKEAEARSEQVGFSASLFRHAEKWSMSRTGWQAGRGVRRLAERLATMGSFERAIELARTLEDNRDAKETEAFVAHQMALAGRLSDAKPLVETLLVDSLVFPSGTRRNIWRQLSSAVLRLNSGDTLFRLIDDFKEPLDRARAYCDIAVDFMINDEGKSLAGVAIQRAQTLVAESDEAEDADGADVRSTLGWLIARRGDYTAAVNLADQIQGDQRLEALTSILCAMGARGVLSEALEVVDLVEAEDRPRALFRLTEALGRRGDLEGARRIFELARAGHVDESLYRWGSYLDHVLNGGFESPSWQLLFQPEQCDISKREFEERVSSFAKDVAETGQVARAAAIIDRIQTTDIREESMLSVAKIALSRQGHNAITPEAMEIRAWALFGRALVRDGDILTGKRVCQDVNRLSSELSDSDAQAVNRVIVEPLARLGLLNEAIRLADDLLIRSRLSSRDDFMEILADVAFGIGAFDDGSTLAAVHHSVFEVDSWWSGGSEAATVRACLSPTSESLAIR